MEPDTDPVLRQLKKLREGRGLTIERLAGAGAVLSAVGTSDPHEGHERLLHFLSQLHGEVANALRVDFGLDLEELLTTEPTPRERQWLGDRRSAYAILIGRDVKTLARWSNQALGDLRRLLLDDTFTGNLYVTAVVREDRILGCSLVREAPGQTDLVERTSLDYENTCKEPSLPCLIYSYPRDWRPRQLVLAVSFLDEVPSKAWGIVGDSFFDFIYATERYELAFRDGATMCTFKNPRKDQLYGVWWNY